MVGCCCWPFSAKKTNKATNKPRDPCDPPPATAPMQHDPPDQHTYQSQGWSREHANLRESHRNERVFEYVDSDLLSVYETPKDDKVVIFVSPWWSGQPNAFQPCVLSATTCKDRQTQKIVPTFRIQNHRQLPADVLVHPAKHDMHIAQVVAVSSERDCFAILDPCPSLTVMHGARLLLRRQNETRR